MATDTLRNARVALVDGLITGADFEAVKVAFLKAQQYKAGLDAGFITPADYAEVKARFLDDVAALSVSGSHSAAGGGPAPSGRSTGELPTGAAITILATTPHSLREPCPCPVRPMTGCQSAASLLRMRWHAESPSTQDVSGRSKRRQPQRTPLPVEGPVRRWVHAPSIAAPSHGGRRHGRGAHQHPADGRHAAEEPRPLRVHSQHPVWLAPL